MRDVDCWMNMNANINNMRASYYIREDPDPYLTWQRTRKKGKSKSIHFN